MLDRIARFCVRRRGHRPDRLDRHLGRDERRGQRHRQGRLPRRHEAARQRVGQVLDQLEAANPTRAGFNVADRVRGAAGGRQPRGGSARWGPVRARSASSTRSTSPAPTPRRRPGQRDRARSPTLSSTSRTITFESCDDARRGHPGLRRRKRQRRRTDGRVRRRHLRRSSRCPTSELLGIARRDRHPDPRVRLGAGDGSADRHRAVRPRRRASALAVAREPRAVDARLRAADRGDDRPRRRHRLRPVHRHALPRGAPRGLEPEDDGRRRDRHRRAAQSSSPASR